MPIYTDKMNFMAKDRQRFSKKVETAKQYGIAKTARYNLLKSLVIDSSKAENIALASDGTVLTISKRLIE